MHELSITQSILDISLRAAEARHAARIRVIRLKIGAFSGVVPDCVQMYLDDCRRREDQSRNRAAQSPLQCLRP